MATQVQFRRGNTTQTNTFTGAVAEVTVDTDKNVVVVHDGSTPGGTPLAKEVLAQAAFDKANSVIQQGFVTVVANGTSLIADSNNDTLTITSNVANGIFINSNATTDTFDLGLLTTGVSAGNYGNSTISVSITVDQFGRVTAISNNAIAAAQADPPGTAVALAIALG